MRNGKLYLVTGGSGFIGSCFILGTLGHGAAGILNLDKLTYSGNRHNLDSLAPDAADKYGFVHGDIGDSALVTRCLKEYEPDAVINFAAETHVDRSIADPGSFINANVVALGSFLNTALNWWRALPAEKAAAFRFLHVSTDEVFGALGQNDPSFTESSPYAPNSPYSASKAAGDHFVRAFHRTYGLPVIITNCSNNYGPRQFPEKLIPLTVLNAVAGRKIPVYGTGGNIRDWLHVEDHCEALRLVLQRGVVGQSYNIGGKSEKTNLEVVRGICRLLDELKPDAQGSRERLITHIKDRPGHDFRYAVNCAKIERELGWRPEHTFAQGLRDTVLWYLNNRAWLESVQSGEYRDWIAAHYDLG
ncbi:MAG: dTDP-glucose 4,6-dehydratase [Desulfovibrio sp.]|jgi:dTDP-glucose 4,6-dehydratase|nr:dTDP-glucose 4,6-dehydratase [Desulfovibrio sp.]